MEILFSALVLVAAVIAPAAARAPSAPPAVVQAELDRLVSLLIPDPAMIELATRAFNYGIEQGAAGDSETKAVYAQYPGLKDHVAAKLRPEMVKIMARELPALRAEVRAVLAAELNAAEIAATATFFGSPTGQKVYAAALRSIGDKPDQSETLAREAAMTAVMSSLAPEDYPALLAFGASSAAGKMNAINPRIAAASRAWADRMVGANGPRMNELARVAANAFVKSRQGSAK